MSALLKHKDKKRAREREKKHPTNICGQRRTRYKIT
jgi:hypothetical protein